MTSVTPEDDPRPPRSPDPEHPALLVDPDRSDVQDPSILLERTEQEEHMSTIDKAHTIHGKADPAELAPLTGDGSMAELTPPPPRPHEMLYYVERRAHERVPGEQQWSHAARAHNAALRAQAADADDANDAIANALATKEHIAHAGDALADALREADRIGEQVITGTDAHGHPLRGEAKTPPMLLLNPFTGSLVLLTRLDPRSAYLVRKNIATSLGYAVVLDLLAEYRAAHAAKAPEPTIDLYSRWADQLEQERAAAHTTELGYAALPPFHASAWAGVFQRETYMLRGDAQFAPKMPPTQPHEILHALHTGQIGNDAATVAAYSALERELIGVNNPALANILQAKQRISAQRSEADRIKNEAEKAYVLDALANTQPVPMDDAAWFELPLYIQFRYSTMLYNGLAKAIAFESSRRNHEEDLDKIRTLSQAIGVLHLEIEAAMATGEIKAAFAQGKLDDRHDIRVKTPATATPSPQVRRAPPPTVPPVVELDPDDDLPFD